MNHRHSARLNRPWTEAGTGASATSASDLGASMPRMNRGSMVARPWRGFVSGVLDGWIAWSDRCAGRAAEPRVAADSRTTPPAPADAAATAAWKRSALRRRRALLALVALSVVGATAMLDQVLLP